MKLKWTFLTVLLASAMFLAACNSGDGQTTTEVEENPTEQQPTEQPAENDAEPDTTEVPAEDDSSEAPAFGEDEASLTYTHNGEQKEEIGYLTESDQQNYSLYKLDGFELTGEEPNKDVLYAVEDDSVFMRIETISTDDAEYDSILNNMTETMEAIAVNGTPAKITDEGKLPTGEGITKEVGYEVQEENGTISGYVFERDGLIVRLTIFDQTTANLTDAFLKMGETVAVK